MVPSFYGPLCARRYDIGTEPDEIFTFYLNQWKKLGCPSPVLEPMCGTGLNLIPFLQAGADADGLDSSPHMLQICQQKWNALGFQPLSPPHLYEQPLETMTLPRLYGFIFIPGGSFGHIYDLNLARTSLQRLADHLLPGGWLVLDVRPPAQLKLFGKPGEITFDIEDQPDGSSLFTTSIWDSVQEDRVARNWNKYERYVSGQLVETEIFDYRERLYTRQEFETLLKSAGFTTIYVTKAYEDETPPTEEDGLVFLVQK